MKQGAVSDRPQWMKAAERELADEHEIHVGNDISDVYRKHYSAEAARVRELREAVQALLSDGYAPVMQKMAEMVKIMQQQESELRALREQIGKLQVISL